MQYEVQQSDPDCCERARTGTRSNMTALRSAMQIQQQPRSSIANLYNTFDIIMMREYLYNFKSIIVSLFNWERPKKIIKKHQILGYKANVRGCGKRAKKHQKQPKMTKNTKNGQKQQKTPKNTKNHKNHDFCLFFSGPPGGPPKIDTFRFLAIFVIFGVFWSFLAIFGVF